MLYDRVRGNLSDFTVGSRRLEFVTIESDDCAKRLLRLATSVGDIGLKLEGPERLRDGDVVHADERVVIAIAVSADDILVGRPGSVGAALSVAHALGNRHLPMQIDGDTLVVRYDPLLPALFEELGMPFTRETRVVKAPFRHAHAPHGHE
jgi:urease accessory protein